MQRFSFVTTTQSVEQTQRLGERLGRQVPAGTTIALSGDLGSGKTAFAQGIARGLQVPAKYYITSPTFTLINEYPGRLRLYHVDLYRIRDPEEIQEIGLPEILSGAGVAVIEWAERLGAELPARHIRVYLEITGEQVRQMTISATGPAEVAMIKDVARECEDGIWG